MDQPRHGAMLPDQVTMGLLGYLNAHALDEDYEHAAQRRPGGTGGVRRIGRAGAIVLAVFALLAITAGLQTSKDSASDEQQRLALIGQVKERKASLDAALRTAAELRAGNKALEDALLRTSDDSNGVLAQVNLLGIRSGITPVQGPGVLVIADDAPNATNERNTVLDTDLQKLVNGLWQAGAEAISINGQRLNALTAIRHAGSAITVNYISLSRPYRILAIGDPKTLPGRFAASSSGQAWLDLQRSVGLRFTMQTQSSMNLPGTAVPDLRYVRPASGTPAGKGTS